MSDWIIEADIYRLERELEGACYPDERARLQSLLSRKRRLLDLPIEQASSSAMRAQAAVTEVPVRRGRRKRTPLAHL